LISGLRALWFSICGLGFTALSVWLNIRFGGPHFLDQLFIPRNWSGLKGLEQVEVVLGPLLLPLSLAVGTAWALRKDRQRRIAGILLATTSSVGWYFGGGRGVSINAMFCAILAIAIGMGLFWDGLMRGRWRWQERLRPAIQRAPAALFLWLLIPWLLVPWIVGGTGISDWNPVVRLQAEVAAETRFGQETRLLAKTPGLVVCESMLRCFFAGKPNIYDPFNSTRLVNFNKLNVDDMVGQLRQRRYGAVQFDSPIEHEGGTERWDERIVQAVEENYVPLLMNADGEIYVPRPE